MLADGTVVAWGDNNSGQTTVPVGLTNITAIAAGAAHSVALRNDGTVVAWGYNDAGQTTVPAALANITGLAAGHYHTVALRADGTVLAWGWNGYGQTTVPAGLSAITSITAGGGHTLSQRTDGTAVAWGDSTLGQTTVPVGFTQAISLAAGGDYTLALRDARIAPVIGTQPVSQSVLSGQPATFSVAATGTPTPTFQWRKNGVAISGATSTTLTLAATTAADAGNYTVVVTNSFSAVTSATATLTIGRLTPILTWPAPAAISYGVALSATQLNATASVPGTFVYNPLAGTLLAVGPAQALSVIFTPTDAANYSPATGATTLTVLPNFASWAAARFTPAELSNPALTGPNAVFGIDGISNLVKYALGLEPKQDVVMGLPEVSVLAPDWVYTYTRPTDRADLTYTVESSTNLITWTTAGVTHEFVSTSAGIDTWRARSALTSAANIFFRLKVVDLVLDTAFATPAGGMTVAVPSGQTRSVSLPLLHASVGAGAMIARVAAVGANFIDVTAAGWTPGALSNVANPYYVRVLTGTLAGRVIMVATTANTATRLFLANDGTDLTQTGLIGGARGDVVELVLADTLGTFFGAGSLQSGADAATADSVEVWNGASWLTFYRNAANNRWQRDSDTAANPTRDIFPVRPDRGLLLTRNAPTDLKLYLTGRVPELAPAYWHLRPGATFLSTGLPVDNTLGSLALQSRAAGWRGGATFAAAAADADLIRVWSGAGWLTFYYDLTNNRWQRDVDASQTNRNTFVIPAGRPIMVYRLTAPVTASESLLPLVLPYTLAR